MEDPYGSYPLAICQQGALFERNPVCALTYRVCMDMCEEFGGLHFNLMDSIEVADEVCFHLVRHAWQPAGIEQYYHWIQGRLNNNNAAVMCACATVCVSVSVMADAPEPLRELGRDMRGLVYGDGNRILENLRSAVCHQDITLSADAYGDIPTIPSSMQEIAELKDTNSQLVEQVTYYKSKLAMKEQQSTGGTTINVQGNYIAEQNNDIHDCTIYATGITPSVNSETIVPPADKPRFKKLFVNPDGDEDFQRSNEECNRFLNFLADHNWSQKLIDSSQDNPINRSIVCFCAKWKALRYIEAKVSPNALLRFLTQTCNLQCDRVDERAIANTLARMIKKGYDQDLFYDVCDYF